jgi:gliding motility-associated-like protein
LLVLLFSSMLNAQMNRFNENWMFGNYAGLNFYGYNAIPVVGSAMASPEGVATISDNGSGIVRFYSNGQKIWGHDHLLIQNGDQMAGNANSTQSALFVPYPKSGNYTYFFTTDAEGGSGGLTYSLLDSDFGTNGIVVGGKKNVPLAPSVTEKLTVMRHCDRQSYWVVAHEWGTNRFFSWRIKDDGLDEVPVVTSSGPSYAGTVENSIGYMKPSLEDDLLALAVTGENRVDLFDFDATTGMPSFRLSIDSVFQPYGIEFSPDQSILYVGCLTGHIYQYSLNAPNIQASRMLVAQSNKLTGALQLAPDGRIYVARDLDYFLGCITEPNQPGNNCNYIEQGIYLSGRVSEAGLPPLIPLLVVNYLSHFSVCIGDTISYNNNFLHEADSFVITFGEPSSGAFDTVRTLPAWHVYHTTGVHIVRCLYYMCGEEYELLAEVCTQGTPGIYLGEDTAICSNTTYYLQAYLSGVYCHSIPTSFLWSSGQTSQGISISPPGAYSLTVSNACGSAIDSVSVAALPVPVISLGPDIELCNGDTALISPFPFPDSLRWNDGSSDSVKVVTSSGYYVATAVNEFNCSASDDIQLVFIFPPEVNWTMEDTVICIGHPMELDAGSGFDGYLWQDGSTGSTFWIQDEGWYYVSVVNKCGTDQDSMYVHLEDCSLKLYIPNAFTPDGDGLNDEYKAYGLYIEDYKMFIFNRMGEMVFYTNHIDQGWDGIFKGNPAPEAAYAWKIIYRDSTGKYHHLSGSLTLIRR